MSEMPTLTKNQSAVFSVLKQADRPLGAYDVLDRLRDIGLRAPPQIYRALQKLQEFGLVHRIETLNAFVACDHAPHIEPAGFIICGQCGRAMEVRIRDCEDHLASSARAAGYRVDSVRVEMRGACATCRDDTPASIT
ncbi:zinc uptake regulation protein [bacterium MnTg02]|nr:zinc uptake regulation protein [bacterium MnTg02]